MHEFKKIVSISLDSNERRLEVIKNSLERSILLHPQVIKNFQDELSKISKATKSIQPSLKSQKELIQKLHGRCHHLRVRREVIDIAENAEKLVHNLDKKSTRQVQDHANRLQKRLDTFSQKNKTSRINAKFLRFANNCLEKARKNEPLIKGAHQEKIIDFSTFKVKEVCKQDYQLAQDLYELAQMLYNASFEEFNALLEKLDIGARKELNFHIHTTNGALQNKSHGKILTNTVRGILGFAHTITDYYTSSTAYPSDKEIEAIFSDIKSL
jgi:hypothetical protein